MAQLTSLYLSRKFLEVFLPPGNPRSPRFSLSTPEPMLFFPPISAPPAKRLLETSAKIRWARKEPCCRQYAQLQGGHSAVSPGDCIRSCPPSAQHRPGPSPLQRVSLKHSFVDNKHRCQKFSSLSLTFAASPCAK